jgi:hypothetical protein
VDLVTPELRNTTARSGRYAETEDEDSDLDEAAAVAVDDQGSVMWEGRWDVAALVWLVS